MSKEVFAQVIEEIENPDFADYSQDEAESCVFDSCKKLAESAQSEA